MSRVRRGGSSWSTVVLAFLAFLVPVALGVVVWQWQAGRLHDVQAAHAEDAAALQAATRETLTWASVDYRKADDYFAAVEKGSTGLFLEQFKNAVPQTRQLLAQNRSVQVPTIPKDGAALVERRSDGTADVLIAMDATVTNKATKRPQPRQYRLKVTLSRVDGAWLTSGLEFIDAES